MMGQALGLLRGTADEMQRDLVRAVLAMLVITGLGIWGDLSGNADSPMTWLGLSITAFWFHYVLTRRAMRAGGLLPPDTSGDVASLFALVFLSNLALLLGFAFLILPGIWLYAHWLAAVPILFAERTGVREALSISIDRSKALLGAILITAGIVNLPNILGLAATMSIYLDTPAPPIASAAINFGISLSQIVAYYLAISIYRAVQPQPLADVFA